MATITIDYDNNKVYILVNNTDTIREKDGGPTYTKNAGAFNIGEVLIHDEIELCIIRG